MLRKTKNMAKFFLAHMPEGISARIRAALQPDQTVNWAMTDHQVDPVSWAKKHLSTPGLISDTRDETVFLDELGTQLLKLHRQEGRVAHPASELEKIRVRVAQGSNAKEIIKRAQQAVAKNFTVLGVGSYTFKGDVDWSTDLRGNVWLKAPYQEMRDKIYTDFPHNEYVIGDIKVPWDLNKHPHFFDLAMGYALTDDDKYAAAFKNQLESWWRQNPFYHNTCWMEPLIVAQRVISWVFSMRFLIHSVSIDGAFYISYLASLYNHMQFIKDHYELFDYSSNHLFGNLAGGLVAALAYEEFDISSSYRDQALDILGKQVDKQIYADGVQYEQSVSYERYVLEFFFAVMCAARYADISLPDKISDAAHRMTRFLMYITSPNGQANLISDADGAFVYKFDTLDINDYRPHMVLGACLFNDAELAFVGQGCWETACWLLGSDYPKVEPAEPKHTSKYFQDGGYVVMRSSWGNTASQLTFDCGNIGMGYTDDNLYGTHGNDDLLSITLSARGKQLLVDIGSGSYTGDVDLHDAFRCSQGHNTISLSAPFKESAAQVESHSVLGPAWSLSQRARPVKPRTFFSDDLDIAMAGHDGDRRFEGAPFHKRTIFYFKPDLWIILDTVEATKSLSAESQLSWLSPLTFHPDCKVQAHEKGFLAQIDDVFLRGTLSAFDNAIPEVMEVRADTETKRGFYALDYGKVVPATWLDYSMTIKLPSNSVWILQGADEKPKQPEVIPFIKEGQLCGFQVIISEYTYRILFPPGYTKEYLLGHSAPSTAGTIVLQLKEEKQQGFWALDHDLGKIEKMS